VPSRKWFVSAFVVFVVGASATVAAVFADPGGRGARGVFFDARKEAAFERGGESGRKGPENPAAEQVEDRAIPLSYVDDARAAKSEKAFGTKGHKPVRSTFTTDTTFVKATSATPGAWQMLGPETGNVPGEAGQFFDPATQTGPSTQESGRVTALAIDPNCGKPSAPSGKPCRLWVAAAGGGIWRTNNALAATPAWIAPPDSVPTNSFG
jgi:hypothetical protein